MIKLTVEKLENIFDNSDYELSKSSVFRGLEIIRKYIPEADVMSTGHDQIWVCEAEKLCKNGLTVEDATVLGKMNWMISEDSISKFI